jgi:hypothetical protein
MGFSRPKENQGTLFLFRSLLYNFGQIIWIKTMRAELPLRFLYQLAQDIAPAGASRMPVISDAVREPARAVIPHE